MLKITTPAATEDLPVASSPIVTHKASASSFSDVQAHNPAETTNSPVTSPRASEAKPDGKKATQSLYIKAPESVVFGFNKITFTIVLLGTVCSVLGVILSFIANRIKPTEKSPTWFAVLKDDKIFRYCQASPNQTSVYLACYLLLACRLSIHLCRDTKKLLTGLQHRFNALLTIGFGLLVAITVRQDNSSGAALAILWTLHILTCLLLATTCATHTEGLTVAYDKAKSGHQKFFGECEC